MISGLGLQGLAINVIFVLIGCQVLTFEPWTARVFIMAVFAEIGAMVLVVVKSLFPETSDRVLELVDRFRLGSGDNDGPGN